MQYVALIQNGRVVEFALTGVQSKLGPEETTLSDGFMIVICILTSSIQFHTKIFRSSSINRNVKAVVDIPLTNVA